MELFKIYLAGPIIDNTIEEAVDWRVRLGELVERKFDEYYGDGYPVGMRPVIPFMIDPLRLENFDSALTPEGVFKPYYTNHIFGSAKAITAKNIYDVRRSDVVITYMPKKFPCRGTLIEFGIATACNIPIIVWTDNEEVVSHPIISTVSPWITDSWNDVAKTIVMLSIDNTFAQYALMRKQVEEFGQ